MPTMNPRVNVTLSPSLDLLVDRLAKLQSTSKAHVLRELLEAAEPALQRACSLMAAAEQASSSVRRGLAEALQAGMGVIEDSLEHELGNIDHSPDWVSEVEAIKGRKRSAGGGAERTRQPSVSGGLVGTTPVALTGGLGRKTKGDVKPGRAAKKAAPRGRV
jgi:hypothetical protein